VSIWWKRKVYVVNIHIPHRFGKIGLRHKKHIQRWIIPICFFFFWWLLYMYYSLYSQTYTPSRNSSFVNRLKLRTPLCVSFTWQWATHESSYFCFLCLEPLGLLRSETPLYKLPDRKTVLPSSWYHNPRPMCSNDWVVILTHLRVFGARMSFLRRAGFSEDAPQKKRCVCMHTCMNACVHFK